MLGDPRQRCKKAVLTPQFPLRAIVSMRQPRVPRATKALRGSVTCGAPVNSIVSRNQSSAPELSIRRTLGLSTEPLTGAEAPEKT